MGSLEDLIMGMYRSRKLAEVTHQTSTFQCRGLNVLDLCRKRRMIPFHGRNVFHRRVLKRSQTTGGVRSQFQQVEPERVFATWLRKRWHFQRSGFCPSVSPTPPPTSNGVLSVSEAGCRDGRGREGWMDPLQPSPLSGGGGLRALQK